MIRHVLTFPADVQITPSLVAEIREELAAAANSRQWRDVILSHGVKLDTMPPTRTPALVRRARALHR